MGRWQPNAQGRLERAALELFSERGYEETTVAEIAARAGLTERTFFRHYTDKREVLFTGTSAFRESFVAAVREAPDGAAAIEAVAAALRAAGSGIEEHRGREFAAARQRIILANPGLRERELMKLADVAAAMAAALRERGIGEPAASLAAELGMAIFRVAFELWVANGEARGLPELIDEALESAAATVG